MRRREFLLSTLASVVTVACGSDDGGAPLPPGPGTPPSDGGDAGPPLTPTSAAGDSDRVFPQGLASGDPRPDRVILWTRVDPQGASKAATDDIDLLLVVAKDEALREVVARTTVTAKAAEDHTVRVVATGLEAGRRYHYRFEAGGVTTQVGRTKTAPDPSADVPVKWAFCACQDYIGRYWHSWKALLEENVDLDFVMYLGDYIYESVNDARFQSTNPDRQINLPDGLDTSPAQDGSRMAAKTLADYRHLYKTYRSDPLLKEVHRLFPFIVTWDDHEFADDCWQDHATSFDEKDPITKGFTDEKSPERRRDANRAFFEYQPADVVYKESLPPPFDIRIYRALRWGKHVEIFMTDQRGFRADHLIAEGPADLSVGKPINNTNIGARYFVRKSGFDPKEANVKPSLLGAAQKTWFIDAVKKSTATWKVWGNEVQVYEMKLDIGLLPAVPQAIQYTVYINVDQWDGFRSERATILGELSGAGVQNLLVCTGDIHSFYAAELHVDFAAPSTKPVGVEYVTAGISSASLKALMEKFVPADNPVRPVIDAWTGSSSDVIKQSNLPYLKYADTNAYGFALVSVDGAKAEVTFVEMGDPKNATYAGPVGRKTFVTDVGTSKVRQV